MNIIHHHSEGPGFWSTSLDMLAAGAHATACAALVESLAAFLEQE